LQAWFGSYNLYISYCYNTRATFYLKYCWNLYWECQSTWVSRSIFLDCELCDIDSSTYARSEWHLKSCEKATDLYFNHAFIILHSGTTASLLLNIRMSYGKWPLVGIRSWTGNLFNILLNTSSTDRLGRCVRKRGNVIQPINWLVI